MGDLRERHSAELEAERNQMAVDRAASEEQLAAKLETLRVLQDSSAKTEASLQVSTPPPSLSMVLRSMLCQPGL